MPARLRARLRAVPRGVLVGAGLLVAAAVVLGLRASTGPVVPAVPDPTPTPDVSALPTGPFDRLPGRTPIPVPTVSAVTVFGRLPATGTEPGKETAIRAVQLVLGRYCLRPDRYTITVVPLDGWMRVGSSVAGLDRGGDGPLIDLTLMWTGEFYEWEGMRDQLRVC